MAVNTPWSEPMKVDTNAVKEAKHLLDIISVPEYVVAALAEFKAKREEIPTKGDLQDLSDMIKLYNACIRKDATNIRRSVR